MRIEGQGNEVAKVTEQGQVHTYADSFSQDFFAAISSNAYTMDINSVTTDGANYWLAVIKNTNDKDLVITSITLWLQSFEGDATIKAYLGSTLSATVTNGTAVTPANLKSGVSGGAEGEFYVNDGGGNIGTITAGSIAGRYIFTTTATKWIKGSGWVIPKNQTFMLWADKSGEVWEGYISFYYHE